MSSLVGTASLLRLGLRRDRIVLPVWWAAVLVLIVAAASSLLALYPAEAERVATATNRAALPVLRALKGNPAGASVGALAIHEMYMYLAVMVLLMSTSAVVRHTRHNEETGSFELVGSGVVGRSAALAAALLVAAIANLGVAVAVALGLVLSGAGVAGAIAAGLGLGGVGLVFAGVAAVTAQLTETARAANGLALAVGGVAFLLRAAGDTLGQVAPDGLSVASAWPSWISPLAWGQLINAFHGERWWILGLFVATLAGLLLVAWLLLVRRDAGMGLIPTRPGPPEAGAALRSALGLAWRLQRGTLTSWLVVFAVSGALLGFIGADADVLAAQDPQIQQFLATLGDAQATPQQVFLAATLAVLTFAIAAYGLQAVLRIRHEEAGPLEATLSTAVSRSRILASHLLCATLGAVALLLVAGITSGLVADLITGEPGRHLAHTTTAAIGDIPAVLAFIAFVAAAVTITPQRSTTLAWAGLATSAAMTGLAGAIALTDGEFQLPLGLPPSLLGLSPFTHSSTLAATTPTTTDTITLTIATLTLLATALTAFRHRDLTL